MVFNIHKPLLCYRSCRNPLRLPDALDGFEEVDSATPQRIDEDRSHARRHSKHAPNRINEPRCSQRNSDAIEQKYTPNMTHHLPLPATADCVGIEYGVKPFVKDDHVGRFSPHVCPTTKR